MRAAVFILAVFMSLMSLTSLSAFAAEEKLTLDKLLQQVEQDKFEKSKENQEREALFARKKNQQARLLARAKAELKRLEARAKKLENVFNENELQLSKLNEQLIERLGAFAEMFGVLKQAASEMQGQLKHSLISGERKGRAALLEPLVKTRSIPSVQQIQTLWQMMLDELIAQGAISTFSGTKVDGDGTAQSAAITRLGPFVAIADGRYLNYLPDTQQYRVLGRQPPSKFLAAAENVEARTGEAGAGESAIISAAIDPARGGILALLVETPRLTERIQQGGFVGYVIILIAFIGLALGTWRLFILTRLRTAVDRQAQDVSNLSQDNPLGRVLAAVSGLGAAPTIDSETLELKLHDAILRELPELESYLPLIRIFAAIAPLLGLLGTVIGMILTFQAITLFGTGDPKLMAGGISQALITTVLGLITAVPLILLHALAVARARNVRQVLEEQAAALVVRRVGK